MNIIITFECVGVVVESLSLDGGVIDSVLASADVGYLTQSLKGLVRHDVAG